jgi:hypothetical protein
MDKLKYLALPAALLAGTMLATPTNATLMLTADVGGNILHCVDQVFVGACADQNAAVGNLTIANGTSIGGVTVNGSITTSTGTILTNPGSTPILNTGSLSIINNNATTVHILAAAGDINFVGPVTSFNTTTSGTFQTAQGSTITTTFYNDTNNAQGAETATDTPGLLIDTFSFLANSSAASYSHDNAGAVTDGARFSMTEAFDMNLTAGGQLINKGQVEIKNLAAVPEPGSLLILGGGLIGLAGIMGWRRRKTGNNILAA